MKPWRRPRRTRSPGSRIASQGHPRAEIVRGDNHGIITRIRALRLITGEFMSQNFEEAQPRGVGKFRSVSFEQWLTRRGSFAMAAMTTMTMIDKYSRLGRVLRSRVAPGVLGGVVLSMAWGQAYAQEMPKTVA